MGWDVATAHDTYSRAVAANYGQARTAFITERAATRASIAATAAKAEESRTTLATSDGKVLDQVARDALAAGITAQTQQGDAANSDLIASLNLLDSVAVSGHFTSAEYAAATVKLLSHHAVPLTVDRDGLEAQVTAAVTAWHAEQNRLAAAVAQAAADAQAADDAKAKAAAVAKPKAASAGGSGYTLNVRTTGFQAELDACSGAVDLSGNYGIPTIGEHWSCGGRGFPTTRGTVITLTGLHAGTWRVEGVAAVLNADTQRIADLPAGFDLLYQTCINGSSATMSLTGLTRIS